MELGASLLVGFGVFLAAWAYAIFRWGLIKGLTLGWLPALASALAAVLLYGFYASSR